MRANFTRPVEACLCRIAETQSVWPRDYVVQCRSTLQNMIAHIGKPVPSHRQLTIAKRDRSNACSSEVHVYQQEP